MVKIRGIFNFRFFIYLFSRVILRNECASDTYTTEMISKIFHEEGGGVYDSRHVILGHIQQGALLYRITILIIRWKSKSF